MDQRQFNQKNSSHHKNNGIHNSKLIEIDKIKERRKQKIKKVKLKDEPLFELELISKKEGEFNIINKNLEKFTFKINKKVDFDFQVKITFENNNLKLDGIKNSIILLKNKETEINIISKNKKEDKIIVKLYWDLFEDKKFTEKPFNYDENKVFKQELKIKFKDEEEDDKPKLITLNNKKSGELVLDPKEKMNTINVNGSNLLNVNNGTINDLKNNVKIQFSELNWNSVNENHGTFKLNKGLEKGDYYLIVSNNFGESNLFEFKIIDKEEDDNKPEFNVIIKIIDNSTHIHVNGNNFTNNIQFISINDLSGKVIYNREANSKLIDATQFNIIINNYRLPKGEYVLKIRINGEEFDLNFNHDDDKIPQPKKKIPIKDFVIDIEPIKKSEQKVKLTTTSARKGIDSKQRRYIEVEINENKEFNGNFTIKSNHFGDRSVKLIYELIFLYKPINDLERGFIPINPEKIGIKIDDEIFFGDTYVKDKGNEPIGRVRVISDTPDEQGKFNYVTKFLSKHPNISKNLKVAGFHFSPNKEIYAFSKELIVMFSVTPFRNNPIDGDEVAKDKKSYGKTYSSFYKFNLKPYHFKLDDNNKKTLIETFDEIKIILNNYIKINDEDEFKFNQLHKLISDESKNLIGSNKIFENRRDIEKTAKHIKKINISLNEYLDKDLDNLKELKKKINYLINNLSGFKEIFNENEDLNIYIEEIEKINNNLNVLIEENNQQINESKTNFENLLEKITKIPKNKKIKELKKEIIYTDEELKKELILIRGHINSVKRAFLKLQSILERFKDKLDKSFD